MAARKLGKRSVSKLYLSQNAIANKLKRIATHKNMATTLLPFKTLFYDGQNGKPGKFTSELVKTKRLHKLVQPLKYFTTKC